MKCPNCGVENIDDARFCAECGASLESRTSEYETEEYNSAYDNESTDIENIRLTMVNCLEKMIDKFKQLPSLMRKHKGLSITIACIIGFFILYAIGVKIYIYRQDIYYSAENRYHRAYEAIENNDPRMWGIIQSEAGSNNEYRYADYANYGSTEGEALDALRMYLQLNDYMYITNLNFYYSTSGYEQLEIKDSYDYSYDYNAEKYQKAYDHYNEFKSIVYETYRLRGYLPNKSQEDIITIYEMIENNERTLESFDYDEMDFWGYMYNAYSIYEHIINIAHGNSFRITSELKYAREYKQQLEHADTIYKNYTGHSLSEDQPELYNSIEDACNFVIKKMEKYQVQYPTSNTVSVNNYDEWIENVAFFDYSDFYEYVNMSIKYTLLFNVQKDCDSKWDELYPE